MENVIKLDAWDFTPGQNLIGDMAIVHIPINDISWHAHSSAGRLDIGIGGSVIHLLERDENGGEDQKMTEAERTRAHFNIVGPAYWIEEEAAALYDKIEATRSKSKL